MQGLFFLALEQQGRLEAVMTITLHGGPWNGLEVAGYGQDSICIAIYEAAIPIKGQLLGVSIYEVEGQEAFWLENRWDGVLLEEIDTCDED